MKENKSAEEIFEHMLSVVNKVNAASILSEDKKKKVEEPETKNQSYLDIPSFFSLN